VVQAHLLNVRSATDSVPQNWQALQSYLKRHDRDLQIAPAPRQFAGGFANLNYLIVIDGEKAVLRRPPMGVLPPGAYDMGRESKILSRLWERFPLAPRALHLCLDATVIGAPFQITEYRAGVSFRDPLPAPLNDNPAVALRLGNLMIDTLQKLHRVDPADVGLDDLGKPAGFLSRAVDGWSKRAHLAADGCASPQAQRLIDELSRWLRDNQVPDGRSSLLHNDFKLDNILLHPETLDPVAVLDWDQGTRGDGLFDLATLLSYWTEAGDPDGVKRMAQMPTTQQGFPARLEAATAYAAATGRDLSDFRFYRVLAQFKTAVIFQQLHARWRRGGTTEARYAMLGDIAQSLLEFSQEIAAGRIF
jgi:aminoglycoside phosphotransferase (APT) family kinase protein